MSLPPHIFAVIGAAWLATCAAAFPASQLRTFKSWTVGCDNTLSCRAVGFAVQESETNPYVALDREGGPAGAIRLRLAGGLGTFGVKDETKGPAAIAVIIDDAVPIVVTTGLAYSTMSGNGEGERALLSDGPAIETILAAMKNGRTLRYGPDAEKAKAAAPVSLDGLAATLLFIDDAQGRVGTVTALSRKGGGPAGSVPNPPEPVRITPMAFPSSKPAPAFPTELIRRARGDNSEECLLEDSTEQEGKSVRLSDVLVLYEVPCWLAAYQSGAMLYLDEGKGPAKARPLVLETIDEDKGALVRRLKSITDPQGLEEGGDGTLLSLSKGRGIGDCGVFQSWAWTGEAFGLASYATMPQCRGVFDSEDWIVLWRTRAE